MPEVPPERPGEGRPARTLEQLSERFLGRLGRSDPPAAASESGEPCDLHVLRAVALALSAKPAEPEAALEAALQAAVEVAGGAAIRLYLLDAQGLLRMSGGRGRWENLPFLALVLRLEAGTLNQVVRCPEPVLMRERFEVAGPPEMAASDEVHCLALPLRVRAQARGVLLIFREAPFGTAMLETLGECSAGVALIIDYLELLAATLKRGSNHPPGK